MKKTLINDKWDLILPDHRAARPEWPEWEKERLEHMHNTISRMTRPVVFDIGAEEGDFPALFASWGAEVVPFEPNPLVWPNIKAIWDANKLKPFRAYWVGFASDETLEFPDEIEPIIADEPRDGWPACAYGELIGDHGFRNVSERPHDTPQITVDDFVEKHALKPHVITIDIEGAELKALKGAEQTLKEHGPVVYVSIHSDFMRDMYDEKPGQIHDFMKKLGYVGEFLAYDHEEHWVFV